ncbi:putative bifunctional diguanylate cyclase/phosphodiesterase [Rhodoferax ferrireducens]|uniref:putative bifunctional diguanylate cyclase/phosphodiesterase n=1 Tax=Rhodoferax ferrireducens TaxID=192843 RepID=UPI000E0D143A|nr:EAL domain-containing protein [Rhodoferax ferrireducens]
MKRSNGESVNPRPVGARLWPRRLGWRLALGFGSVVALMLMALALASLEIRSITHLTQRFATQDMQRLLRVQTLSLYTEGAGNALLRLMNAPREHRVLEYTEVDERNRRIEGIIASLADLLDDPAQESTLQRLVAARAAYSKAFKATVAEIERDRPKAAMRVYTEQVQPSLEEMLIESNTLINRERERVERQMLQAQKSFEQLAKWVAMLSLLAVMLAIVLALRTTRSVVTPLAQLEATALRIAGGDYSSPVLATSAEEVNRVGQALTTMTTAIAARERDIENLAFRDPLTGLPNRTYLLKPTAEQEGRNNCLMLIDLARLKTINESLGFATGDTLIKEVAQRADTVVKRAASSGLIGGHYPLVTHLAGGRFAVSFSAPDRPTVERLRLQLEQAMAQPVLCSGYSVDLSLDYGFADSTGQNAPRPVSTLLRNAEVALHAAKRAAVRFAWYSEAQEAARLSHLGLVSDLRVAVATSQLQMWLQPKFSLSTGRAVGAEALVRWQHPQRGFVSPAEFVPFAEQTGYIGIVTTWMLGEALHILALWAPHHPELSISVNVSTRDLQDPKFCSRVKQLIELHGVDPRRLRLEIVESGLMEDPQHSVAVLHALGQLGVQLSIDDFGTGYSSLAYLQQLPVSELKIDRSFVGHVDVLPATQRLVKSMIEMGHGMGLLVTAEGVETEAEKETVTRLGCDVMQGNLGSGPLHGKALQAWFTGLGPVPA